MKLAWLTDVHLNFLDINERKKFYQKIINTPCDSVLISGDIAEAPSIKNVLQELSDFIEKPVYFVLGNHDYYRGQVSEVRSEMIGLTESSEYLFWLPASGPVQLDKHTVLIGQDGWADGRLGNYQNSPISLNDSRMITNLFQEKLLGKSQLLQKMQQLADLDANALHNDLLQGIEYHPHKIIVLTHVPPFKEACLHNGQLSDDNWLPYFSSKAMGDVLMPIAENNPSIDFLVLCGHMHSDACYLPLKNLVVKTGKAEYYQPAIQEIIKV